MNIKEKEALPNNTKGLDKGKRQGKLPLYLTPTTTKAVSALIVVVICSLGIYFYRRNKAEREYIDNIHLAVAIMTMSNIKCLKMSNRYSYEWRSAIEYDDDFNIWLKGQRADFEKDGSIENIDKSKESVENILLKLNDTTDFYPRAHEKLITLYGIYSQINSLASYPTGSLMTYNAQTNKLQTEYLRVVSELMVLLPKKKIK